MGLDQCGYTGALADDPDNPLPDDDAEEQQSPAVEEEHPPPPTAVEELEGRKEPQEADAEQQEKEQSKKKKKKKKEKKKKKKRKKIDKQEKEENKKKKKKKKKDEPEAVELETQHEGAEADEDRADDAEASEEAEQEGDPAMEEEEAQADDDEEAEQEGDPAEELEEEQADDGEERDTVDDEQEEEEEEQADDGEEQEPEEEQADDVEERDTIEEEQKEDGEEQEPDEGDAADDGQKEQETDDTEEEVEQEDKELQTQDEPEAAAIEQQKTGEAAADKMDDAEQAEQEEDDTKNEEEQEQRKQSTTAAAAVPGEQPRTAIADATTADTSQRSEQFCHQQCGGAKAQRGHSLLCRALRGALGIEETLRQLPHVRPSWGDSEEEMRPQQQYNPALQRWADFVQSRNPEVIEALYGLRITASQRKLLLTVLGELPRDEWLQAARSPIEVMLTAEGPPGKRLTQARQGALVSKMIHLLGCATAETESQCAGTFLSGQVLAVALLVMGRDCLPPPSPSAGEDFWHPQTIMAQLLALNVAPHMAPKAEVLLLNSCCFCCML